MFKIIEIILSQIRYFLNLITFVIGYLFYPNHKCYLPPIKNSLLLESATKLSAKIKTSKLKSEDLVKIYISRCKEINKELNSIIDDNFEEALKEARLIDERVQRELNGEKSPNEPSIHEFPFLGIPFTTKNSIPVKGLSYSGGTYYRKDVIAEKDCEVIRRMKNYGGAIFLALTNVPELVLFYDSFNRVNGQTNNPYDKSRIPGGSSGGEAALISSAGSVIGIGSDIGGSIRIPSNFCGIFGHLTTPQIVTIDEIFPTQSELRRKLLSQGPMCRYACDLRPMLKILVGDKLDLSEKPLNYSNLNVYYIRNLGDPLASPVDVDILKGLDKVVKYFINKGSKTLELNMAEEDPNSFYQFKYGLQFWWLAMNDPDGPSILEAMSGGEKMNSCWELLKCAFGFNKRYTASVLVLGVIEKFNSLVINKNNAKMLERLKRNLHQLLGNNGVLLCPTFPETAPKHNEALAKIANTVYTCLWNTMNVAITNVPLGLDRHGLPFSIQVIVSPENDNLSIQIAEELEKQFGGWIPPCALQLGN